METKNDKNFLSVKQCLYLNDFGLNDGKTHKRYAKFDDGKWVLTDNETDMLESIPAYSLEDLLKRLPDKIKFNGTDYHIEFVDKCTIAYKDDSSDVLFEFSKGGNMLDTAYDALCWHYEMSKLFV